MLGGLETHAVVDLIRMEILGGVVFFFYARRKGINVFDGSIFRLEVV
jgi:hypothetical protein